MLFLPWLLLALAWAHIRVDLMDLTQQEQLFVLKVSVGQMLNEGMLLESIPKFIARVKYSFAVDTLHHHLEAHAESRNALLSEVLRSPENAAFMLQSLPGLLLIADGMTDQQVELVSAWGDDQLKALCKFAISPHPGFVKLVWHRCKDPGIALLDPRGEIEAAAIEEAKGAFTPSQRIFVALLNGESVGSPSEQLDITFVHCLCRWLPLFKPRLQLTLLYIVLFIPLHTFIQAVPHSILLNLFNPDRVLFAMYLPTQGIDYSYLMLMVSLIAQNDLFWIRMAMLVPSEAALRLPWGEFCDSIQIDSAKRNIQAVFLPAVLSASAANPHAISSFLRKACRQRDDFSLDCLVERDSVLRDLTPVANILLSEWETSDETNFLKSTVLALRFVSPFSELPGALIKKVLSLDVGLVLSVNQLHYSQFVLDCNLMPKLIARLIIGASYEIGGWATLLSNMLKRMPNLVSVFLTNHPNFFFQRNEAGFEPTWEASSMSLATLFIFIRHGVEPISSIPGLRFPLWLNLLKKLTVEPKDIAVYFDLNVEEADPVRLLLHLLTAKHSDLTRVTEKTLNLLAARIVEFIQLMDPTPNFRQDYPFMLVFIDERYKGRIND